MPNKQTAAEKRIRRHSATRRRRKGQAGMTLLELLVVIAILGLLATTVGTVALSYLDRAKSDATQLRVDHLLAALDLYRLDMGRFPSNAEGLNALMTAPAGAERWSGPYLHRAETLEDAWGNLFLYENPGQHGPVDIYSLGADEAEGGEDENRDITSW